MNAPTPVFLVDETEARPFRRAGYLGARYEPVPSIPARNNRATVSRPRSLDVPIPRGPYDAIVANVIVEMHRLLLGRWIPHTCAGWAPWLPPAPHTWRLLLDERASIDGVVCNGCGQVIP